LQVHKWLYISLFVGLILFKPIFQLSWEIWYSINIEYVAEELCENQEVEELECNGKCYLAKQLEKAEQELPSDAQESDQVPPSLPELEEIPAALLCSDFEITSILFITKDKHFFNQETGNTSSYHFDIFHPPQV
jgi:hypothetical protein